MAQSSNSAVCTTGIYVPELICIMQPILPALTTSGFVASSVETFSCFSSLEIAGCIRLQVPAEPQQM